MDDLTRNQSPPGPRLTLPDMFFLIFLVFSMVSVVWVGRLAYQEGMNNEITKRNGELWTKWFTQAGLDRSKASYEPAPCTAGAQQLVMPVAPEARPVIPESTSSSKTGQKIDLAPWMPTPTAAALLTPVPRTWGPCLKALTTQGGPLAETVNPFTRKPIALVAKCDMADRRLAGGMVLEKTMPTAPGSAIPFISSPLIESDQIDQKMQIRVTVCDKGAYPIRIAELEF